MNLTTSFLSIQQRISLHHNCQPAGSTTVLRRLLQRWRNSRSEFTGSSLGLDKVSDYAKSPFRRSPTIKPLQGFNLDFSVTPSYVSSLTHPIELLCGGGKSG